MLVKAGEPNARYVEGMSPWSYDPFDARVIDDPYKVYATLREEHPCYYVAKRDIYVLSRFEDVRAALSNTSAFSSNQGVGYLRSALPMLISTDPPEHTRLRRIVAAKFTPRALAAWTARIQEIASSLLDPLINAGEVDFVSTVAAPFPIQVIAEMMGIPIERRADFKRWSANTIELLASADLPWRERSTMNDTLWEFAEYFAQVIRARREGAADHDDLISLLIRPADDGVQLTESEIISFCVLLLVAGNETTTNLIGNCMHHLARHAQDWQRLVSEPALVRGVIEESLRHEAPIQGFFRNTRERVIIGESTISASKKVLLLYAAANRDPRKYEDPERFRIDRQPADHLAFGFGPHTCLGAFLARLEMRVLLEHALTMVQSIELQGEGLRTRSALLRGFQRLPLRMHRR
jgi:cytochrome P450